MPTSAMPLSWPLTLALNDEKVILVGAVFGVLLAIYTIHTIRQVLETRAKEQTKREIAAYVAEGSMKAEDGARLISGGNEEAQKMIADGVAWGVIKPEKAESLLRSMRSEAAPAPAKP